MAQKDLDKIKGIHNNLLDGMALQSQKVQTLNNQKAAEMQNQQTMENDMEKEKMAANTQSKKNEMDFALKQGELDVKRAALSMSE